MEGEGKGPTNKCSIRHKIREKEDLKQGGVLYWREVTEVNQCPLELGKMAALNGIYKSDRRTESQCVLRENQEAKIYTSGQKISDETKFPRVRWQITPAWPCVPSSILRSFTSGLPAHSLVPSTCRFPSMQMMLHFHIFVQVALPI